MSNEEYWLGDAPFEEEKKRRYLHCYSKAQKFQNNLIRCLPSITVFNPKNNHLAEFIKHTNHHRKKKKKNQTALMNVAFDHALRLCALVCLK